MKKPAKRGFFHVYVVPLVGIELTTYRLQGERQNRSTPHQL